MIPQGPREGDHVADGRVEIQCRTLRLFAEHNTGVPIADDSSLLS